eukprot:jgi/Chlat1/5883/Chrsp4S06391
MQEEDFEREIKVVVVGQGGVGKTSLIRRFTRGTFSTDSKKTIGVDFFESSLHVESLGEDVRLMLWDTAGQEEFDSMTRAAAVLMFSTDDRASLDAVSGWKSKVEAECGPAVALVLVQNKMDLLPNAAFTPQEAEQVAKELGMKFYRTCVKENLNVAPVSRRVGDQARGVGSDSRPGTPREATPNPFMEGGGAGTSRRDVSTSAETINLNRPSRMRTHGKKSLLDRMNCKLI